VNPEVDGKTAGGPEVGDDPQLTTERLDVLPDGAELGRFKRALLELADSGLGHIHRLGDLDLGQLLGLADLGEPVRPDFGQRAGAVFRDLLQMSPRAATSFRTSRQFFAMMIITRFSVAHPRAFVATSLRLLLASATRRCCLHSRSCGLLSPWAR
jgi:hypothetical protein